MDKKLPPDVLAIRALNDNLRQTRQGGRMMLTTGISSLGNLAVTDILARIASFDAFTGDNDPYGEHDCASIVWAGQTILFKIDYYDPTLQSLSDDPTDPSVTTRVMTVMLASEY